MLSIDSTSRAIDPCVHRDMQMIGKSGFPTRAALITSDSNSSGIVSSRQKYILKQIL